MTEADVIQPSASIASTGKGIRYIGKHCYAYSGSIQADTTPVEHLNFTTGSGYIMAEFTCIGSIIASNPAMGDNSIFPITFNDILVATLKTETREEDMPTVTIITLVIPPFTKIIVKCDSSADTAGNETSVTVTGRVYGAE